MRITVAHDFLPKACTVRATRVMDHFGIGFEQGRHLIADSLDLPIRPGQVVVFTGPSGSGKSSLMRATAAQLEQAPSDSAAGMATQETHCPPAVLDINALPAGDDLLIDALPLEPLEAMQLLAQCGLSEARLLLRRPCELSDGQRYRFQLAKAVAHRPAWLVADEFTAALDRTLAKVIAFNLRRLTDRTGIGFLLATTHEDVVDDLAPDVHVRCSLNGAIEVLGPSSQDDVPLESQAASCRSQVIPGSTTSRRKKKESALRTTCGSARRPVATGRTSLGGITGATSWP